MDKHIDEIDAHGLNRHAITQLAGCMVPHVNGCEHCRKLVAEVSFEDIARMRAGSSSTASMYQVYLDALKHGTSNFVLQSRIEYLLRQPLAAQPAF